MKRIKIGDLIAGLGMGVITFTGVTTIYHFSNGAIFSNAGTPSLSIPSNPPSSATPVTIFGGPISGIGVPIPPPPQCVHSSTTYYYDGAAGWDGTPQYFTITPSITACMGSLTFVLYGGGGGGSAYSGYGGSGGLTTGVIPINALSSNTLIIIAAGGGQPFAGGGGSFVCLGTQCNMSTVLLAAGGGGGASLYNGGAGGGGNQDGQNGIVPCGSIPQGGTLTAGGSGGSCSTPQYWYVGNNGIGGAGGAGGYPGGYGTGGVQGTPFGDGGQASYAWPGGYGGGGGGGGSLGGAGGGGYFGGGGDDDLMSNGWGSGAGGSGYCAPIVQNCGGAIGGANNGGLPNPSSSIGGYPGGNGKVIISW